MGRKLDPSVNTTAVTALEYFRGNTTGNDTINSILRRCCMRYDQLSRPMKYQLNCEYRKCKARDDESKRRSEARKRGQFIIIRKLDGREIIKKVDYIVTGNQK